MRRATLGPALAIAAITTLALFYCFFFNSPPAGQSKSSEQIEAENALADGMPPQIQPTELAHLRKEFPIPVNFESHDLHEKKKAALLGSGRQAAELVDIYGSCIAHHLSGVEPKGLPAQSICIEQRAFWQRVALENGLPTAMASEFGKLAPSAKCLDVYRANFWLRKAVEGGLRHEPWITMLNDRNSDERNCVW
jgi:hypothetical protein